MTTVRVKVTDDDYQKALQREFFRASWKDIKASARRIAVGRMLQENLKRQNELIARNRSETGTRYLETAEGITRLFEEHDALLVIAFPEERT